MIIFSNGELGSAITIFFYTYTCHPEYLVSLSTETKSSNTVMSSHVKSVVAEYSFSILRFPAYSCGENLQGFNVESLAWLIKGKGA